MRETATGTRKTTARSRGSRRSQKAKNVHKALQGISFFEFLKELESDLDLPAGFCASLAKEDDWSFIIKLHSLVEAAATRLIVESLGRPQLAELVSRLELSGQTTGKIALIKVLELASDEDRRFIIKLSELRNLLVHEVSNVGLTLSQVYASLEEHEVKGFRKAFRWGHRKAEDIQIKVGEDMYDPNAILKMIALVSMDVEEEKMSIWLSSLLLLRRLHFATRQACIRNEISVLNSEISNLLFAPKQSS